MRHGSEYVEAFERAAAKSLDLGLLNDRIAGRRPDLGRARDAYELVGRNIDTLPYDSTQIRLMCGQIHSDLWRWLRKDGIDCSVTIGDVEVDGKREFGTSYERLDKELSGALRHSRESYPFHVWLTFPDLHILDATWFVYKHHDLLPVQWQWSEFVICSDHPIADSVDTRYVPYLVGDASLVERIIFDEATARLRCMQLSPREIHEAQNARVLSQRAVSGKVGRNEPCPCGSGAKFKKCHGSGG